MVEKLYICEKVYIDHHQLLEYCFYYSFILYYCAIFYSLDAGFFSIPSGCQTVWIQIRPNILSGLIWVQTVCNGYQQTTKFTPSLLRVNTKQLLAKILAKVNIIWLQLFPFGQSVGYKNSEPG